MPKVFLAEAPALQDVDVGDAELLPSRNGAYSPDLYSAARKEQHSTAGAAGVVEEADPADGSE